MFSEARAIKQLGMIARFDFRKEIPSHFPAGQFNQFSPDPHQLIIRETIPASFINKMHLLKIQNPFPNGWKCLCSRQKPLLFWGAGPAVLEHPRS